MIARSRRVVLVADSSKIGKVTFARICGASAIDEFITDAGADAVAVKALSDSGVHVTLVYAGTCPAGPRPGGSPGRSVSGLIVVRPTDHAGAVTS